MIAFIHGKIVERTPAFVVMELGGIGYHVNISLYTHERIVDKEACKLYTHVYLKEQSFPVMYGFAEMLEKELFLQFISVSGVGPNTARMILSSYSPSEIREAVIAGNVGLLKSIKGIGPKSAQRLVLELADKFEKTSAGDSSTLGGHNTLVEEALSALTMLGIGRPAARKAVDRALKQSPVPTAVEDLVKSSLKLM